MTPTMSSSANECFVEGVTYTKERVQYLNASHSTICKFPNPEDSNYLTLKNALATAVDHLLRDGEYLSESTCFNLSEASL